jgi:hypothetical protein
MFYFKYYLTLFCIEIARALNVATTTLDANTWSVDLVEYDFEEVDRTVTGKDRIASIVNNLNVKNLREKVSHGLFVLLMNTL